ncbi:MAG: Rubrerythrin [Lentisphaerae bacterium ADurb.BinA184]|nr:MAG: Rubrerythrin [Lentisphaerae bacterium ADurb.BinA184]
MSITRATILQIALAIENKGIAFYSAAARRFADPLIEWLIGEEKRHIRVFQGIFGQDGGRIREERFEVPHLDDDYLVAAFAGTEVFGKADPAALSQAELFGVAVEMEKNSILFYRELSDALPERFAAEIEMLRQIESEEHEHLRRLAAARSRLEGK